MNHSTHFYSYCVSLCINHINDVETHTIACKHVDQSTENAMKLQREHEVEMKKNSISESNI